ncbi:hypothetical protein [Gilliamella sp. WF3-4]|jgi:hypothetical protein|uniref:hypothetical protein n=1 Tax=Gilliamella sp. WF3-4 TaxID=3120255 RepID=UPI00080E14FF|nr:hypothetical protein [Gilliamella apicola]OCG19360.1 hypothetical protein A9G47_03685 [Gilliamella apicola]
MEKTVYFHTEWGCCIHYTDSIGLENIMRIGVLESYVKGKVYITDILMIPKDVMANIIRIYL